MGKCQQRQTRTESGNIRKQSHSNRDTDVLNGLLDSEGEGEGGMMWENGIETCILSCKSMFDAGYRMLGAGAWG